MIKNVPENWQEARDWGQYHFWYDKMQPFKSVSLIGMLRHVWWGLYYRYPWCCIKYFIGLHLANIPAAAFVAATLKDSVEFRAWKQDEHVPCPKCFEKNCKEIRSKQ